MRREKTKGKKKKKKRGLVEPKSPFKAYKMRHLSSFSCCFPSPRKNKRKNPMKEYLNLIKKIPIQCKTAIIHVDIFLHYLFIRRMVCLRTQSCYTFVSFRVNHPCTLLPLCSCSKVEIAYNNSHDHSFPCTLCFSLIPCQLSSKFFAFPFFSCSILMLVFLGS